MLHHASSLEGGGSLCTVVPFTGSFPPRSPHSSTTTKCQHPSQTAANQSPVPRLRLSPFRDANITYPRSPFA